jgi:hypothetical protein
MLNAPLITVDVQGISAVAVAAGGMKVKERL